MAMLNNMNLHERNGVKFLSFPSLDKIDFVKNCFSTRIGGVSEGPFATLNLRLDKGDDNEKVIENMKRLCDAAGFEFDSLVAGEQDHGTFVRPVTAEHKGLGITREGDIKSVDGLITNVPNVTLITYYADCVPLYFVDVCKKAIGLSHAGWRGTVSEMALHTVEAMQREYGTDPKDIVACIGPSIGQCCYEVDSVVIDAVKAIPYINAADVLISKDNGKAMLNLQRLNALIMEHAGIPKENIHIGGICTCCNSDLLYSHRVLGNPRGTLAAMLCINGD